MYDEAAFIFLLEYIPLQFHYKDLAAADGSEPSSRCVPTPESSVPRNCSNP